MALGARAGDVLWLVLRQSLMVTAAGVAAGIVGALVSARVLSSFLIGVHPPMRSPLYLSRSS
jgi:ABC-type antimicrobial peptide transport system permease subunit